MLRRMILVALCIGATGALAQDTDPLAILKSDAPLPEKAECCRQLQLDGGPEAVATLEALLTDAEMAHMARYALEAMPGAEALAALRRALEKTSGLQQIGIINSLQIRKDAAAAPALIGLLQGADDAVAQAAAEALGAIASPEAVEALDSAARKAGVSMRLLKACCDGLSKSAEAWLAQGKSREAKAVYAAVLAIPNAAPESRAAALRGAVLSLPDAEGHTMLREALLGEDPALFGAGLRVARELPPNDKATALLLEVMAGLAPEKKIRIMQVLGERKGSGIGALLLKEAEAGPEAVRIAALKTLTRIACPDALPLLKSLAVSGEGAIKKTAQDCLSYFPGEAGDAVLLAMLEDAETQARLVAVELIGLGGVKAPVGILMGVAQAAEQEAVRIAALDALTSHAGLEEMPVLIEKLLANPPEKEAQALESLLRTLCARQKRKSNANIEIDQAFFGDLPDGKKQDVTNKVKAMVASGALSIDATNGNFGDAAPGVRKKLEIVWKNSGVPAKKLVAEGESITLTGTAVPPEIVDAFCEALPKAADATQLALLRLLAVTGSPKAFAVIQQAFKEGEGAYKATALEALCAWPSFDAFPVILDLYKNPADDKEKVLALRGVVRLLRTGTLTGQELLDHYAFLMAAATTPDDKKLVLSGLGQAGSMAALEMILPAFKEDAVKAEAVQAAISVARQFGGAAKEDPAFFNAEGPSDWRGNLAYWRLEDGVFIGESATPIPRNEFLWSDVVAGDFYLSLDVKLEPETANAGVQFRSAIVNEQGQAKGYQADMGKEVWGRLYHEHGRGKLDWLGAGEEAIKPGDWNHYEILAIGPLVWTALNGVISVAMIDLDAPEDRTGKIAFQVHKGDPQKAQYRIKKFVHNPKVEMHKIPVEALFEALRFAPET